MGRECWLVKHGIMENGRFMPPCDGRLVRAHLIPRQLLVREGLNPNDTRTWVFACGGPTGASGHHGMFDYSRKLRVLRPDLPWQTVEFALEHGLTWYLERTYSPFPPTAVKT